MAPGEVIVVMGEELCGCSVITGDAVFLTDSDDVAEEADTSFYTL